MRSLQLQRHVEQGFNATIDRAAAAAAAAAAIAAAAAAGSAAAIKTAAETAQLKHLCPMQGKLVRIRD